MRFFPTIIIAATKYSVLSCHETKILKVSFYTTRNFDNSSIIF